MRLIVSKDAWNACKQRGKNFLRTSSSVVSAVVRRSSDPVHSPTSSRSPSLSPGTLRTARSSVSPTCPPTESSDKVADNLETWREWTRLCAAVVMLPTSASASSTSSSMSIVSSAPARAMRDASANARSSSCSSRTLWSSSSVWTSSSSSSSSVSSGTSSPKPRTKSGRLSARTGIGGGASDWSVGAPGSDLVSGERIESVGRDGLGPNGLYGMGALKAM